MQARPDPPPGIGAPVAALASNRTQHQNGQQILFEGTSRTRAIGLIMPAFRTAERRRMTPRGIGGHENSPPGQSLYSRSKQAARRMPLQAQDMAGPKVDWRK